MTVGLILVAIYAAFVVGAICYGLGYDEGLDDGRVIGTVEARALDV
jgi:hypothetical protein